MLKDLERIKWYLWHGNVFQALNEPQNLEMDLDAAAFETKDENAQKLLKGVEDCEYRAARLLSSKESASLFSGPIIDSRR